jgi:hypothetical protein
VARGKLWVHTFREGAFSALGHDLEFELAAFELEQSEGSFRACLDLRTLEPRGAMRAGTLEPGALTGADLAQIRRSAHEVVLETTKYQTARVQGRYELAGEHVEVHAELAFRDRTAPLDFVATRAGGVVRARIDLTPSHFGIKPYRAFLGALRLRDHVEVVVEIEVGDVIA